MDTLTETVPVEAPVELTAKDRCDRCGAQAYVRVELYSGLDLLFCGHHYTAHSEALDEAALRVDNHMEQLVTS